MIAVRTTIASVASLAMLVSSTGGAEDEPTTYDCGTMALYNLFRIEGRPTDLRSITAQLPEVPARGYSMIQLRDAARTLGFRLTGVRLSKRTDRAPSRPVLAFLSRPPLGHYITVRPVGHTGRLVQVIDPNHEPYILDAAELYAAPEWTGIVLIPDRTPGISRWLVGIAVILGLLALMWAAVRRFRRPRLWA